MGSVYNDVLTADEKRREALDQYGNVASSKADLAKDGAFAAFPEINTVAVLHLYSREGFDFSKPTAALEKKGFKIHRWTEPPSWQELKGKLATSGQLWLISADKAMLSPRHISVIKEFFDAGHGVYLWGDNDPYYADANAVAAELIHSKMAGNIPGNQVVRHRQTGQKIPGFQDHLVTRGLDTLYEGITIATVENPGTLTELVYGSATNLVTALFDNEGKRLLIDGGFTRLYCNWDTAGTERYVVNAAAWLANVERFVQQQPKIEFVPIVATQSKSPKPKQKALPKLSLQEPDPQDVLFKSAEIIQERDFGH